MLFGPVSIASARGAILAHSLRTQHQIFRKGRILQDSDLEILAEEGIREVIVARLEAGDVSENEAAARVAAQCGGRGVRTGAAFTGRTNLHSEQAGIARIDSKLIAAANAIHESITIASVSQFARVVPGELLATIKIIPFAAPESAVAQVEALLRPNRAIEVFPFASKRVALISTELDLHGRKLSRKNENAITARLSALGSTLVFERRVVHKSKDVCAAIRDALVEGADPVLVFGASAITDRRDVIPSAIVEAGGEIERFGMPVDPGNLLLLGSVQGRTVIGLPGCARSPKRNGFDFVLERVLADIPVAASDIAAMGVGGLLSEISSRPQPRERAAEVVQRAPRIAAIVLAAGLASRMGRNKLTESPAGKPLVRNVVEAATQSHATSTIVVTGNESRNIEDALSGLAVTFVYNPAFRDGLSSSLKAGVRAVSDGFDGALVLLGDMPGVTADTINRLIAAFNPLEGRSICVASHLGKRGNPVLWARQYFPGILALEGDVGAKHLIGENEEMVCEVEAGSDGPLVDIDTPEALSAWMARAP